MYKNARNEEEEAAKVKFDAAKAENVDEQQQSQPPREFGEYREEDDEEDDDEKEFMSIPSGFNPLKDPRFIDMDEDQFESEVKDLIEWSNNLDYNEYVKDWFQLSTSNASEAFVVKPVNTYTLP